MRITRILIYILAAALLLAACAPAGDAEQNTLNANRNTWQEQGIRDYHYTIEIACFCPTDLTRAVTIEVRDGMLQSMNFADNGEPVSDRSNWERYETIDELFAYLQSSIEDADSVNIQYDATYGFPATVGIDVIEEAVDDELGLRLYDFEVVDANSAAQQAQDALTEAQQLWQSQGIANYRLTLQVSCFCAPDVTRAVVVEVHDGAMFSISDAETGEGIGDTSFWERYDTIDRALAQIQEAIDADAATIDVQYDATYGFPANVFIDFDVQMADEESRWTLSNFEPIDSQDAADALAQARELWQSQGITEYRFTLQVGCFCIQDVTRPVVIEVRGGEVQSITFADTGEAVSGPSLWENYNTIDRVLGYIQNAIDENAAVVRASYDAAYGFPTELYIDFSYQIADEESGLTISDFEPIEVNLAEDYAAAQAQWQAHATRDYRFTLQVGCFCPLEATQPAIIEVRDGRMVSIVSEQTGEAVDPQFFAQYDTIDKLLAIIGSAIPGADVVSVSFDETYGYPSRVNIDYISEAMDDEQSFRVTDFEAPIGSAASFTDEFDGVLDTGWEWVREDAARWSLTDAPGYLSMTLSTQGMAQGLPENLLLRDAPQGDFEITTVVSYTPSSNFQFAGLLIYQNDEAALQLGYAFASCADAICKDAGVYFDDVRDDQLAQENSATLPRAQAVHLSIRREGTTYTAYYALPNSEGVMLGQYDRELENVRIGLIASQAYNAETTAAFDFFTVQSLP